MLSEDKIKYLEEISKLPANEQQNALQDFLKTLSKEEIEWLQSQQCVFCNIIAGRMQASIVYHDERCLAILDINPASKGHTILLPRQHIKSYWQLDEHIDKIARVLSLAILDAVKADGINIMSANGAAAGQAINHAAMHLIPRYKNDGLNLGWEGNKTGKEELKMIAMEIRKSLLEKGSQKIRGKEESSQKKVENQERKIQIPKKESKTEFVEYDWMDERVP